MVAQAVPAEPEELPGFKQTGRLTYGGNERARKVRANDRKIVIEGLLPEGLLPEDRYNDDVGCCSPGSFPSHGNVIPAEPCCDFATSPSSHD